MPGDAVPRARLQTRPAQARVLEEDPPHVCRPLPWRARPQLHPLLQARQWAAARHGLREYAFGREKHSQPADPQRGEHFHCYIKFGKEVEISDRLHTTVFDMAGRNGRTLHPELQGVGAGAGDRERVIRYDMKDGDHVGELETPLAIDPKRDEAVADGGSDARGDADEAASDEKSPGWAVMLNKASSTRQGMELLAERAPQIYYLHGSKIEPMLQKRVGTPVPKLFSLADFNRPALDLDLPTVLHGVTDCRKTAFAKAHFECPLVVRRCACLTPP